MKRCGLSDEVRPLRDLLMNKDEKKLERSAVSDNGKLAVPRGGGGYLLPKVAFRREQTRELKRLLELFSSGGRVEL
jgi:hypothetical protein